jgi:hypothetical protein
MGGWGSQQEERMMLDVMVPQAFRLCVNDLSTGHLTDEEKAAIEKYVFNFVATSQRCTERLYEQMLLDDYSHLI